MASLSTCHLGLWLGWQILLNLVKFTTVVRKEENLAVRGSHMQLQLGASNFIASGG